MGCRAITPALVGLARKLEGRPFHLVATHCQRQPREKVLSYLKSQKFDPDSPNFTVSSFGGHPRVKGSGYVPYYMVFDHHGRLARHHMGGPYHGGDGLGLVTWVEKLLKEAPRIYVGREEYRVHADLAKAVASGKNLARSLRRLDELRANAEGPGAAELERLHQALVRYRDRALRGLDDLVARDPGKVLPGLKKLRAEVAGSSLVGAVDEALERHGDGRELRESARIASRFKKLYARYEALPPCPRCKKGGKPGHDEGCKSCRSTNAKAIAALQKKVLKLIEKHQGLPVVRRIEDWIASLDH